MGGAHMTAKMHVGTLVLDVTEGEITRRLRTEAPFADVQVDIEQTHDEPPSIPLGPRYVLQPPTLRHVDLTVRVRMMANSTPDGTLYRLIVTPPAETIEQTIRRVMGETQMLSPGATLARKVMADELIAALKERGHA